MVTASDPTVRGGATNPFGLKKTLRAMEVAERNRLRLVQLIESSGADLPTQSQIFDPGGILDRSPRAADRRRSVERRSASASLIAVG